MLTGKASHITANVNSMPGEALHQAGAEGVKRAKRWLEATTRAHVYWEIPEANALSKLEFEWADGSKFSFDLGGVLVGGPLANQLFLAECKKYKVAGDQGTHHREFLAKCFRVYKAQPDRADNFIWMTWAPFRSTQWDVLCSAAEVIAAAEAKAQLVGIPEGEDISADAAIVADRLWIVVLSDKQEEHLTMTHAHLAVIRAYETNPGDIA